MDGIVPSTVGAFQVENLDEGDWVHSEDDSVNVSGSEAADPSSLPDGTDHSLIESPYVGQTFGSLQELNKYMKSYAEAVGFQWRRRSSRKDDYSDEICSVRMVCSREGASKSQGKLSNSLRVGCDVALTSSLQKDGQWKINRVNLHHCHEINPNPIQFLQQQRSGSEEEEEEEEEKEEADRPVTEPPYDGQTFGSLQAMLNHLRSYAKAVGFKWRTRSSRKDKNGKLCGVRIVCSKEGGAKTQGKRPNSLRVGCGVGITCSLHKDGWWRINKINLQHCHEIGLNATPFLERQHQSTSNDRSDLEEDEEEEGKEKEEADHSSLPNGSENPLTQSPYNGQVFRTLQVLVEHLNSYAEAVGFQWRTRSSRKDKNNGEICSVRMVCSKEGANKLRGKNPNYFRPSLREGCDVSATSSLQKNGWWKINKINLQHCHENDPNATPFLQRYRAIPPHMRYPLLLNDRSGMEEEEEEGPQEPSPDKNASCLIDDAIMEEQPSFEAPFSNQGAVTEMDTTDQQSCKPTVNIEQQWKKLRRYMNILIDSNLDNINQLGDMERTVDILICHYSGDDIKNPTLRDMKQLLAELKDRISFMRSSKESAQSELANFHKENPNFLAILEREELALKAEESKLSQFTLEEARIEAEIQKLMEMKESVVSQKASAAKTVEEGKQKMDGLKNKNEKIKKTEYNCFKWQGKISKFNVTAIATLRDARQVLFH